MTHLDEATIAVYGADVADEGAVLMIYNVQFKLVQAAQKLKLYTNDAKLWKVEDKLLLAANRHLAVAPFHLAPQRIAAMVGSSLHFRNDNHDTDDIVVIQEATVAHWDKNETFVKNPSMSDIPSNIRKSVQSYLNEGWCDSAIHEVLIPRLMETGDVMSICWCLNTFRDLPEKLLVDLLVFALKNPDKVHMQNGTSAGTSNADQENCFLDKLFDIRYSSVSLLPYLKTTLTFDQVLKLLEYLMCKLNEETDLFDNNPQLNEYKIYDWICVLLDSHYQHYLLSRDAQVSKLFDQLNSVLEDHVSIYLKN